MNYKLYLYIFLTMLSAFSLSAINFEKIIRKNHVIETRILYFILSFSLGYLLTNMILAFLPEVPWKTKFC